eukprot:CAMPEP_0172946700 /NCGR_PEP_ID=MMETSP1075-20121228/227195_1 /TAXON_ID=2916 /ORGANISM="Ceratium fusus, Strain PA161109" /LENGTH=64 /DNA_ID=CAMNT_0013808159 /DNA_START=587 /DNA_END=781 /DNA_ORIENTATION=+
MPGRRIAHGRNCFGKGNDGGEAAALVLFLLVNTTSAALGDAAVAMATFPVRLLKKEVLQGASGW